MRDPDQVQRLVEALGGQLRRLDSARGEALYTARLLELDGHDSQARALRAFVRVSYAADDCVAVAQQLVRAVQSMPVPPDPPRVWALCLASALVGGVSAAAVVGLLLR